ncbi:MAG: leucine-rich repeat protein [Clostridia bacterium]|nr:leucine-rich repeat protein [Clostridia bacterium]
MRLKKVRKSIVILALILLYISIIANIVIAMQGSMTGVGIPGFGFVNDEDNNIVFEGTTYDWGFDQPETYEIEVLRIDTNKEGNIPDITSSNEPEWRNKLKSVSVDYTLSIGQGIEKIGDNAFEYMDKIIKIDTLYSQFKKIGKSAFRETSIEYISLPRTCEEIDEKAFMNCSKLESVSFKEGLKVIGNMAFESTAIREIKLPNTCEKLGYYAFLGCEKLETINLNEGLREIGMAAFAGTSIKEIELPSTCEILRDYVFQGCAELERVYLNEGLKEIGCLVFAGTNIKEIELPNTCEKIGDSAFNNCKNLERVYLNEGLREIGVGAFSGTPIKEIKLPSTVKEISVGAFENCTNLTEIEIPSSVETIQGNPFLGCTNLKTIKISEEKEYLIWQLRTLGLGDKLEIVGDTYLENGIAYNGSEILQNKKYILVNESNLNLLNADKITVDEKYSDLSIDGYITYLIKNSNENYYVCETDNQGKIVLLGQTSTYNGFYNGQAYKDGRILKDVIITLPKGTNIDRNANTYTNYDIISEDKLKEIESLKQENDIYIIDQHGELSSNIIADNKYNKLIGDVNVDGKVDITDIIYLNKYIVGVIKFNSEQLQAADCYSDNVVNSLDLLALLRYIVELENELPIKEKDSIQKQEFINQMDDEFYNMYIKPTNANLDFLQIAKLIHREVREEAIKEEGKMQYTDGNVEIKDVFINGSFGEGINEKAYVGLCLYEYGIHTQNEDLVKYIMEYNEQGNYKELYNITDEKLNELGWQKIEYTSKEQLKSGDIIISESEVQIYNGNGVYSCGSNEEIRKTTILESIEPGTGRYIIRIEPTSGKSGENLEWNLEEGTLQLEVKGDINEEQLPWKSSINNIAIYKVNVNEEYLSKAINVIGNSIQNTKNTNKKTVIVYYDSLSKVVKLVKEHQAIGDKLVSSKFSYAERRSVITLIFEPAAKDKFYADYIEGKINSNNKADIFYDISKIIKEKIKENSQSGNMDYSDCVGICIPYDIYYGGNRFGPYMDCSTYVSMALYEYGLYTGNTNIVEFIKYYREEIAETGRATDIRSRWSGYSRFIS